MPFYGTNIFGKKEWFHKSLYSLYWWQDPLLWACMTEVYWIACVQQFPLRHATRYIHRNWQSRLIEQRSMADDDLPAIYKENKYEMRKWIWYANTIFVTNRDNKIHACSQHQQQSDIIIICETSMERTSCVYECVMFLFATFVYCSFLLNCTSTSIPQHTRAANAAIKRIWHA